MATTARARGTKARRVGTHLACMAFLLGAGHGCMPKAGTAGVAGKKAESGEKSLDDRVKECIQEPAKTRDWTRHPGVARVSAKGPSDTPRPLYVMSDIHGNFENFFQALLVAGVISTDVDKMNDVKPSTFKWIAGEAVLVHAGDLISKGADSIRTMKFAQNLQFQAERSGGQAIFIAGNHEIGFIGNPTEGKFSQFVEELRDASASDIKELCRTRGTDAESAPKEPFGVWLANLPIAAIVAGVYISHTGWTRGLPLAELETKFENFVKTNRWADPFLCGMPGADAKASGLDALGVMNANGWWNAFDKADVQGGLKALLTPLGATQILFGHDPGVFKSDKGQGNLRGFLKGPDNALVANLDAGIFQGNAYAGVLKCPADHWSPQGGCGNDKGQWQRLILPSKYKPFTPGSYKFESLPTSPERPSPRAYTERTGC